MMISGEVRQFAERGCIFVCTDCHKVDHNRKRFPQECLLSIVEIPMVRLIFDPSGKVCGFHLEQMNLFA